MDSPPAAAPAVLLPVVVVANMCAASNTRDEDRTPTHLYKGRTLALEPMPLLLLCVYVVPPPSCVSST